MGSKGVNLNLRAIEVIGSRSSATSYHQLPPPTTSEKTPAAATQRIRVVSIKMLSTQCRATP